MAFTREFIRRLAKDCELELPKDFVNGIIEEHISARDAHAEEKVREELAKHDTSEIDVKKTDEYKALKQQFDDYKAEVEGKAALESKEKAVRAYFESKGITGKNLEIAVRGSKAEIEAVELDGETIKNTTALDGLIGGDFAGLVTTTQTQGAPTATPPTSTASSGAVRTREEIMKIKDTSDRQKAWADYIQQQRQKG